MEGILSHMEPGRGQWPGVEASGDQRQVCDNGSKNGREGTMAKLACMPRQHGGLRRGEASLSFRKLVEEPDG